MSQHRSLRSDRTGGHYRNVLKRWEKIKHLLGIDKWDEEKDSLFHLPKIKRIKIKIRKKKSAEKKEEEVSAETTTTEAEGQGQVEEKTEEKTGEEK